MAKTNELKTRSWGKRESFSVSFGSRLPCERLLSDSRPHPWNWASVGPKHHTGLAFDGACNRLGRGGGYYDCFIQKATAKAARLGRAPPLLVALAYSVQLRDSVPMDPQDMPVDLLVTAHGIVRRQAPAVA